MVVPMDVMTMLTFSHKKTCSIKANLRRTASYAWNSRKETSSCLSCWLSHVWPECAIDKESAKVKEIFLGNF